MNNKIFALAVLALAVSSCGKNLSGTYSGTQTMGQPTNTATSGQTSNPTTQQQNYSIPVTITLNQGNGDAASGTWISGAQQGTWTGRISSANRVDNVTLIMSNQAGAYMYSGYYGYGNYYGGYGASCSGTFVGSFDISVDSGSNHMTGNLQAAGGYCQSSMSVDATSLK